MRWAPRPPRIANGVYNILAQTAGEPPPRPHRMHVFARAAAPPRRLPRPSRPCFRATPSDQPSARLPSQRQRVWLSPDPPTTELERYRAGALPTHACAARALAMRGPPRASTPPAPRPVRTPVDLCSRGPCDCRTGGPMFTSCAWTRRCLGRLWSPREAAHRESQLCASGRCASHSCASAVAARRRHEPYAHCHRMTARIFVRGRNT